MLYPTFGFVSELQANIKHYNEQIKKAVQDILKAGEGLDYFQFKAACELAMEEKQLQNRNLGVVRLKF